MVHARKKTQALKYPSEVLTGKAKANFSQVEPYREINLRFGKYRISLILDLSIS